MPLVHEVMGMQENMTSYTVDEKENTSALLRKGVAGDWKNYFTPELNPGLLTFSFLLFHVFFYLQITFFYFLEFYTKKFQERSNSGWVFLLLLLLLFYFFSHFVFLL